MHFGDYCRSRSCFCFSKTERMEKGTAAIYSKQKSSLSDTVFEASELADDVYVTVYGEKSECRAD